MTLSKAETEPCWPQHQALQDAFGRLLSANAAYTIAVSSGNQQEIELTHAAFLKAQSKHEEVARIYKDCIDLVTILSPSSP